MTELPNVKDVRRERLQTLIETNFGGSRRDFCERIRITKGRVSQMLAASFGEAVARSIEVELSLPSYFLDGMVSKQERQNAPLGVFQLVYVTEREQKLLTAFRVAQESGKDFIEKAAKASGFI
jgi:hypothetical protein